MTLKFVPLTDGEAVAARPAPLARLRSIFAGLDLIVQTIIVLVIGALLVALFTWLDPFHWRLAKVEQKAVEAQVETKVARTQADVGQAVQQLDTTKATRIANTQARTQKHVAEVEATRKDPVPDPDPAFYRGVCASSLYEGHPYCRGVGE